MTTAPDPAYEPNRPRLSAYAVRRRDGAILLTRLTSDGRWTLPGGGVEFGEHPEVAARRELLEETGYVVTLTALLGIDSIVAPGTGGLWHAVRIVYAGEIGGGVLTAEVDGSTDRAAWVPLERVPVEPRVELVDAALAMAGRA